MSHEAYLFSLVIGLLGLLQLIGLGWVKTMGKTVDKISEKQDAIDFKLTEMGPRMTHMEVDLAQHRESTNDRIIKVAEKTSDLADDISVLVTTVALCKHCPHPGSRGAEKEIP